MVEPHQDFSIESNYKQLEDQWMCLDHMAANRDQALIDQNRQEVWAIPISSHQVEEVALSKTQRDNCHLIEELESMEAMMLDQEKAKVDSSPPPEDLEKAMVILLIQEADKTMHMIPETDQFSKIILMIKDKDHFLNRDKCLQAKAQTNLIEAKLEVILTWVEIQIWETITAKICLGNMDLIKLLQVMMATEDNMDLMEVAYPLARDPMIKKCPIIDMEAKEDLSITMTPWEKLTEKALETKIKKDQIMMLTKAQSMLNSWFLNPRRMMDKEEACLGLKEVISKLEKIQPTSTIKLEVRRTPARSIPPSLQIPRKEPHLWTKQWIAKVVLPISDLDKRASKALVNWRELVLVFLILEVTKNKELSVELEAQILPNKKVVTQAFHHPNHTRETLLNNLLANLTIRARILVSVLIPFNRKSYNTHKSFIRADWWTKMDPQLSLLIPWARASLIRAQLLINPTTHTERAVKIALSHLKVEDLYLCKAQTTLKLSTIKLVYQAMPLHKDKLPNSKESLLLPPEDCLTHRANMAILSSTLETNTAPEAKVLCILLNKASLIMEASTIMVLTKPKMGMLMDRINYTPIDNPKVPKINNNTLTHTNNKGEWTNTHQTITIITNNNNNTLARHILIKAPTLRQTTNHIPNKEETLVANMVLKIAIAKEISLTIITILNSNTPLAMLTNQAPTTLLLMVNIQPTTFNNLTFLLHKPAFQQEHKLLCKVKNQIHQLLPKMDNTVIIWPKSTQQIMSQALLDSKPSDKDNHIRASKMLTQMIRPIKPWNTQVAEPEINLISAAHNINHNITELVLAQESVAAAPMTAMFMPSQALNL